MGSQTRSQRAVPHRQDQKCHTSSGLVHTSTVSVTKAGHAQSYQQDRPPTGRVKPFWGRACYCLGRGAAGRPASPLPPGGARRGARSGPPTAASGGLSRRPRRCLWTAWAGGRRWPWRQGRRALSARAAGGATARGGCRRGRTARNAHALPASPRPRGPASRGYVLALPTPRRGAV